MNFFFFLQIQIISLLWAWAIWRLLLDDKAKGTHFTGFFFKNRTNPLSDYYEDFHTTWLVDFSFRRHHFEETVVFVLVIHHVYPLLRSANCLHLKCVFIDCTFSTCMSLNRRQNVTGISTILYMCISECCWSHGLAIVCILRMKACLILDFITSRSGDSVYTELSELRLYRSFYGFTINNVCKLLSIKRNIALYYLLKIRSYSTVFGVY